jgi:hypothetical protein
MPTNGTHYLRWTPGEWQRVAAYALQYIDRGLPPLTVITRAARAALPRERLRDAEGYAKSAKSTTFHEYVTKARQLTPEQLEAIVPPPQKHSSTEEATSQSDVSDERGYRNKYSRAGTAVRWTTLEKARIARQVNQWRAAGDMRALTRLIIEAQEIVIEHDRRRPIASIQTCAGAKISRLLEEGTHNEWLLVNEEAAAAQKAAQEAALLQPAHAGVCATDEAIQDHAQAPGINMAPTPAPGESHTLTAAAAAFGAAVSAALDKLLAAHTEAILERVCARFESTAATASAALAAQIERGMRDTVHRIVENELGGPVSAPFPAEGPTPRPVITEEAPKERAPQLRVDVVGLIGQQITEVKSAFNGDTDLRFVDADQVDAWQPSARRHVVCWVKFHSHKVDNKLKQSGLKPIRVNGGVGTIIHAIDELRRSHQLSMN